jgi:hypothetical protein
MERERELHKARSAWPPVSPIESLDLADDITQERAT